MTPLRSLLLLGVVLPAVLSCSPPFKPLSRWCIYVDTSSELSWTTARKNCQAQGGDLITLDSHDKMQSVSQHLSKTQSDGSVFWVGGENVGGSNWKWAKTSRSIKIDHLWLPGEPSSSSGTQHTKIVPADRVHGRYYLISEGATRKSPGYVCEK